MKKLLIVCMFTFTLYGDSLPLQGKKFGVEFNIPRLLTYSDSWKSLSGTFSYFQPQERVEIAFPWIVSLYTDRINEMDEAHFDVHSLDVHYRQFLGEEMDGFYLSGFVRAAYLNGLLDDEDHYKKTMKFGLGVGLGYRFFSRSQPYYWGIGLIVGRYITGENDIYREVGLGIEDTPLIIDVEFLKFGYAF